VASAPGKVLMIGGYLVLKRPNAGIVLSTNARFYAIIQPFTTNSTPIPGLRPYFILSLSYYLLLLFLHLYDFLFCESRNPFVEQAVQYVVAAAHVTFDKNKDVLHKLLLQGLDITILGCNDFYYRNQIEARGLPLTPKSLDTLPHFTSITLNAEDSNGEGCKPEVAKTGLGSSAAMTTAVVAGLLHYLGVVNLPSSTNHQQEKKDCVDLDMVHIIAQSAHCIAQGKVGSGFDVSSAVSGSQCYVQFSPEVIFFSSHSVTENGLPLQEVIVDILKGKWDHERTKFSLPPLMNLLLGEPGSGGSSTPSMVGAVKKWQKSDPQKSLETWKKLTEANLALEAHFTMLSKLTEEHWDVYKCMIKSCSMFKSEK
ncbi:GHMP_kinases_N domain-containing protein, partial [Cephalotus follicularis]